jgi:hypothetical protein
MSDPVKKPTRKKRLSLPGQVKYTSLKDAFDAINNTMGEIHVQTHEKVKAQRGGGR